MTPRMLVMAKAPVPGLAKTRLGRSTGSAAAAELAAAALLDSLHAARQAFGGDCHLALTGDLDQAARGGEIAAALQGWTVFDQVGDTFAERLAHAHAVVADSGPGAVVQIGMDTPQITPELLRGIAALLEEGATAVLGPAEDGGWWVLAVDDGARAVALRDVLMSAPTTYRDSVTAFLTEGAVMASGGMLRDVDTVADAIAVAGAAPRTRFAQAWASFSEIAS